ncbi:MAG: penicillin acylase family protein [Chitinophagaceae bacterium]
MRLFWFLFSTILTIALIIILDMKWGAVPPLGKFLSPQQGFWQNAESVDHDYNEQLTLQGLRGQVNVHFDERLVPHIFAESDEDAFYVQGFIHAKFRLWQMEFQTHAAAGRISEILGNDERFIRYDREQRRLGMGYAAENSLEEMEKDPATKISSDAYTAGVNAYIASLTESELPIEYKLLDYKPEAWTNLKIALFIKQMTKDLAGFERDIEFTNAKSVFNVDEMKLLFPEVSDSSLPIIPKGTAFDVPGIVPQKPAGADSLYFKKDTVISAIEINKPPKANGSNSWALNGTLTASGSPILCNDPHLNLSLPSIWYEMQIVTPNMNVYGVTFPGTQSIIIGFNEHIAFGFTNAGRDVKDYYQVKFRDESKREYWFDSSWQASQIRVEAIKVRGSADILDTVAYTVFGPVMYDGIFSSESTVDKALAVRWSAHDASNEPAMWLKLNKAQNYQDYEDAIKLFTTPGQNMLFASKTGDIAVWQQARFPARWEGQGLYIMPGEDSSYMWQGFIPQIENPNILNPSSGFIQSANQRAVDDTYPYFIPGNYIASRGIAIEKRLQQMRNVTPKDMMALQMDYHSVTAAAAVPLFLKYTNEAALSDTERNFLNEVKRWDFNTTPDSKATTIYQAWMDSLEKLIWHDEFANIPYAKSYPDEQTLLELLLKDSAFKYIDDINTSDTETIDRQITQAFKLAVAGLDNDLDNAVWYKHKNVSIYHLLRQSILPFARTELVAGGWGNTINAIKSTHGPSWRMVVHLTEPVEAFGVYPGGQSGNPGSRFYDSFVNDWVKGNYYTLWVMNNEDVNDSKIKWTISFSAS